MAVISERLFQIADNDQPLLPAVPRHQRLPLLLPDGGLRLQQVENPGLWFDICENRRHLG